MKRLDYLQSIIADEQILEIIIENFLKVKNNVV